MTTFTKRLPERKSSKKSAVNWTPTADNDHSPNAGTLTIHTDRASVTYGVSEFPTDWPGRGIYLAKETTGTDPESESYSVFCARGGARADACECKGFTYKGTCKHADGVRALIENGWL